MVPYAWIQSRWRPLSFLILLTGIWGLLIIHLSWEWWNNPQYGYGFLVPFLCGWILWIRRAELAEAFRDTAPPSTNAGRIYILFYLGAALIFPVELLHQISPRLRSIGIVGAILCISLTLWTFKQLGLRRIPKVVFGVAALFLTAVPWPTMLESRLTQSLMKEIAALSGDFLNLMGILAVPRGNLIELSCGIVSIDEACSGVRSIQSCFMASMALGLFFCLSWKRILGLIACGFFLALLGNFFRTIVLVFSAASQGLSAIHIFHDPAGIGILIGVTLVLYFVANKLGNPNPHTAVAFPVIHWARLPGMGSVLFIGIVAFLSAHLWYRFHEAKWPAQREPFLTLRNDSGIKLEEMPVPSSILEVLRPQRGTYYRGYSPVFGEITVYTFFWLPDLDALIPFFHRPDVCMTGVGWEIKKNVERITVNLGGRDTFWYLFSLEQKNQKAIQIWGAWRDGVEQELDFSNDWTSFFRQHFQYWNYIWLGKRKANTEIISVVLDARLADTKIVRDVIQQLFIPKEKQ